MGRMFLEPPISVEFSLHYLTYSDQFWNPQIVTPEVPLLRPPSTAYMVPQ